MAPGTVTDTVGVGAGIGGGGGAVFVTTGASASAWESALTALDAGPLLGCFAGGVGMSE